MNSLLIIGVAAGAVYLTMKLSSDNTEKRLQEIEQENERVLAEAEYYKEVAETEKKMNDANEQVLSQVKPVEFVCEVADYRTTENFADLRAFLKFQNDSNKAMNIIVNYCTVSFLDTQQKSGMDKIFQQYYTIQPHTKTSWKCVLSLSNYLFPANSFGADLWAKYGMGSVNRFFPASCKITYCVSPVDAPLTVSDEKTIELNGCVYTDVFLSANGLAGDPILGGKLDAAIAEFMELKDSEKYYYPA